MFDLNSLLKLISQSYRNFSFFASQLPVFYLSYMNQVAIARILLMPVVSTQYPELGVKA
ncbi:hypothetical protein [Chroococcidiopsis sp.]|uniref:hypothetical protein n=1 Tax=Chroococcidiopsis sp. TaxID=3088168 RepID=UPI003F3E04AA